VDVFGDTVYIIYYMHLVRLRKSLEKRICETKITVTCRAKLGTRTNVWHWTLWTAYITEVGRTCATNAAEHLHMTIVTDALDNRLSVSAMYREGVRMCSHNWAPEISRTAACGTDCRWTITYILRRNSVQNGVTGVLSAGDERMNESVQLIKRQWRSNWAQPTWRGW